MKLHTLLLCITLVVGVAQANPVSSLEEVAPPLVRTWWIITPHQDVISKRQIEIDQTKREVNAEAEKSKVEINAAKTEILDTVSTKVKDINLDIQLVQNKISTELKRPAVASDKALTECWKKAQIDVNSLRAADMNLCVPTQEIAGWNEDLKGITSLVSNAGNIGTSCANMYPAKSQATAVDSCITTSITTITSSCKTQTDKITKDIGDAKTAANTCITNVQTTITTALSEATCP